MQVFVKRFKEDFSQPRVKGQIGVQCPEMLPHLVNFPKWYTVCTEVF
jgi:hypothetical protein